MHSTHSLSFCKIEDYKFILSIAKLTTLSKKSSQPLSLPSELSSTVCVWFYVEPKPPIATLHSALSTLHAAWYQKHFAKTIGYSLYQYLKVCLNCCFISNELTSVQLHIVTWTIVPLLPLHQQVTLQYSFAFISCCSPISKAIKRFNAVLFWAPFFDLNSVVLFLDCDSDITLYSPYVQ